MQVRGAKSLWSRIQLRLKKRLNCSLLKYYIICVLFSFIDRTVTCVCKIKGIFAISFRHHTEGVNDVSFVSLHTKRVPTHLRRIILSSRAIWIYFNWSRATILMISSDFSFYVSNFVLPIDASKPIMTLSTRQTCSVIIQCEFSWVIHIFNQNSQDSTVRNAIIISSQKCTGHGLWVNGNKSPKVNTLHINIHIQLQIQGRIRDEDEFFCLSTSLPLSLPLLDELGRKKNIHWAGCRWCSFSKGPFVLTAAI